MAAFIKGRPWSALFYARRLSVRFAAALIAAPSALFGGGTFAATESESAIRQPDSGIVIAGAVSRPGIVSSPRFLSEAVAEAGGLTPQAYALGSVLLRPATAGATTEACLARHRSWLSAQLSTVPDLDPKIVTYLTDQVGMGRLVRVPLALTSTTQGEGGAAAVLLGAGDVLIIPARASTVAVVGESLAGAQQWRYEPGYRVEDYLDQYIRPASDQRALALYLPDGRLQELRVNYWNYEKQVVPPGSVIWMGSPKKAKRSCGE